MSSFDPSGQSYKALTYGTSYYSGYRNLWKCPEPSVVMLVADTEGLTGAAKRWFWYPQPGFNSYGKNSLRHNKYSNILACDGHVGMISKVTSGRDGIVDGYQMGHKDWTPRYP